MRGKPSVRIALAATVPAFLAGCASPLEASRTRGPALDDVVSRALADEIRAMDAGARRTTERSGNEVESTLAERRAELDELSPAMDTRAAIDLGPDLDGGEQEIVLLDLHTAIVSAVQGNLNVAAARLQPAINQEDVRAAQAIFDYVLFGNVNLSRIDEPSTVPVINNVPLGAPFTVNDNYRFETGVRRTFRSGGTATLSTDLTRSQNNAPGIALSPDPAYLAAVRLGFSQPLLRGFGSAVSTATIRLAENAEASATEELRRQLIQIVDDVEAAYWRLHLAWQIVEVREWLVEEGIRIRNVLYERRDFDTRLAQYSDAVARVEQRRADVIRARRDVRRASDGLKALLDDDELSIGSESVIRPSEDFFDRPVDYALRDSIVQGLEERPEIRQALLAIRDAGIGIELADNALLPQLDITAQIAWFGQDEQAEHAYENSADSEFIDYVIGLVFEYPFGNEAAEAGARRARLARAQTMLAYRKSVKTVVLDVKAALRDVLTNYELIEATRSFRVAQAENLRALLVEEEMLAGLTPEFLNLKFQRQDTLANARAQELEAMANFDTAIASLSAAMGTNLETAGIEIEIVSEVGDAYELIEGRDDATVDR